jgi:hypothetical protein
VRQLVGDTAFQQLQQRLPGRLGPITPQFRVPNENRVPVNTIQPVPDNFKQPAP